MDCQEFFEHPMFNYTGNEPDFFSNTRKKKENGETDKNGISSRETGVENDSVKENNHLDSNMFKMHRETYQQKLTEVELIKETADKMKLAIKPWD